MASFDPTIAYQEWSDPFLHHLIQTSLPSVQEYFRAVREQQVMTDFHLDRLEANITPSKRRKTNHLELYNIVIKYETYESNLSYLFDIAKHFGHPWVTIQLLRGGGMSKTM